MRLRPTQVCLPQLARHMHSSIEDDAVHAKMKGVNDFDFHFCGVLQKYLNQRHIFKPVFTLENIKKQFGLEGTLESDVSQ